MFRDPATAEILNQLLREQADRLRRIAMGMNDILRESRRVAEPVHWSGRARLAHDELLRSMQATLEHAQRCLDAAAENSVRAAMTLAGRVG